jgi:Sulfotransferase domain
MDGLSLYSLSVILSFLKETCGVSLLLTNTKLARQVLPLFRVRDNDDVSHKRHRHRFVVAPIQDPAILLERINTRRLQKRKRPVTPTCLNTIELAQYEWSRSSKDPGAAISTELELLRFGNENDFRKYGPVLLVSYPRSGNTLLRTLLERITGYVTGSDTRPDRSLSRELAEQHNLAGEGVTATSRCNFVKTHWPERAGCRPFTGQRAIVLVRNPYDAIDSYWNMNATKSHTKTLADEVYDRFRDKWECLARNEIHIWCTFLDAWLGEFSSSAPVLIVRFEDLIKDPSLQMTRLIAFSLGKPTNELSSYWKERIVHATTSATTATLGSYQPRTSSGGRSSIGKSIKKGHYSDEMLQYIQQAATKYPVDYLRHFGYSICEQNFPENIGQTHTEVRTGNGERIQVNSGMLIRPVDCPFGRLLQKWRHSHTDNDANPLPTI